MCIPAEVSSMPLPLPLLLLLLSCFCSCLVKQLQASFEPFVLVELLGLQRHLLLDDLALVIAAEACLGKLVKAEASAHAFATPPFMLLCCCWLGCWLK
ncbi:hypothetical protein COO60DRAFT_1547261 [Scenedesmus sp. NREL 46B-D3]|nr:hypothetical protein COO60DRAFT_1547261 [Scenedesmus sp. NREL 46B-D3]